LVKALPEEGLTVSHGVDADHVQTRISI